MICKPSVPKNLITVEECSWINHITRDAVIIVDQSSGFGQCELTLYSPSFLEITRKFVAFTIDFAYASCNITVLDGRSDLHVCASSPSHSCSFAPHNR